MMYGWSMGWEAWLWMGAWLLALFGLVWLLVREPRRNERDEAMDALKARLGRGEITPDEFERARRLLEPTQSEEHTIR
jgi:uncharacterized membrane protein